MTLLSSKPQSPWIPLCVLCTTDGSSHQLSTVIDGLRLDSLLSAGLMADYRVYLLSPDVISHSTLSTVRVTQLLPPPACISLLRSLKVKRSISSSWETHLVTTGRHLPYGITHSVPPTRRRWTCPALTPAGTQFIYPGGWMAELT